VQPSGALSRAAPLYSERLVDVSQPPTARRGEQRSPDWRRLCPSGESTPALHHRQNSASTIARAKVPGVASQVPVSTAPSSAAQPSTLPRDR